MCGLTLKGDNIMAAYDVYTQLFNAEIINADGYTDVTFLGIAYNVSERAAERGYPCDDHRLAWERAKAAIMGQNPHYKCCRSGVIIYK